MKTRIILLAPLVLLIASQLFAVGVQAHSGTSSQAFSSSVSPRDKLILEVGTPLQTIIELIIRTFVDWSQKILLLFQQSWLLIISDAVFLVLVIIFLGWLIRGLHIFIWEESGKLGPIFIDEISDRPEITVLMRRYLTDCGAKCSHASAPNASPGFEKISTALASTSDSKAQIIGVFLIIIEFLFGSKKAGYTVSWLLTGDESKPPVHIYIEIKPDS